MPYSIVNVALVLLLYSASRLFFYLANLSFFPEATFEHLVEVFLGGMRFDLTATLYLSSPYLIMAMAPIPVSWRTNRIYAAIQKWLFIIPNFIGLLVNAADIAYIPFSGGRTTCSFFSEFGNDSNLFTIFTHSVFEFWYITLFVAALIIALIFLYRPYKPFTSFKCLSVIYRKPLVYYPLLTIIFLPSIYMTVIGMRGGFGAYTRPINMNDALQYSDNPAETALVLNTPFSLMMTIGNRTFVNPNYFPDDELDAIMTPNHPAVTSPLLKTKPNVVIFILESFAAEHVGFYNPNSRPFTPFLDSLLAHSIVFTHAYSNGRKSIDAPPAILASIPKIYEPFVTSSYSTRTITSIAKVLNDEGYHTTFLHGAPNGSMGFSSFTHNAGFTYYSGYDEYIDDPQKESGAFDGTWGIWDEPYLLHCQRLFSAMPEPFCSAIFTVSSHHPFVVPEQYEDSFPHGPTPLNHCIAYTDHALRRFFHSASSQQWYNNTIFVFVADHTNENVDPDYSTDEGLFRIPIAFYIPSCDSLARIDSTTMASQLDIFPSIIGLVGSSKPYFAFGENLFSAPKQHNYAITYQYPYFQAIAANGYIQFDGTNLTGVYGDIPADQQEDMLRYLKAIIQLYISHILSNSMQ